MQFNATLLSRNLSDFNQIPDLHVEINSAFSCTACISNEHKT